MFVEKLFRCLESESYMKAGEDPIKTPPINNTSLPACSVPMPTRIVEKVQPKDRIQSYISKSDGGERRQSEDFRRKEVR